MSRRAPVPAVSELLSDDARRDLEDTRSDAQRRGDRIRALVQGVAQDLEAVRDLVREAKAADDHLVLGFPSWTAYLADLFGTQPLHLAREVRRELVAELAAQGMSTRAIAPIVGATKSQVARDIAAVPDGTPEPVVIAVNVATGEVIEDAPITGLDGKTYARPTPRRVRPRASRPSLTARVEGTLGLIDQTVYANEDNSARVTWRNDEVLELLAEIRRALTGIEREQ